MEILALAMDKRTFLGGLLALCAAPFGTAQPVAKVTVTYTLFTGGKRDDTRALKALLDGERVLDTNGRLLTGKPLYCKHIRIRDEALLRHDGVAFTLGDYALVGGDDTVHEGEWLGNVITVR